MPDITPEQLALLGKSVVVTNPTLGTSWRGSAIAIADQPSIIIEPFDGGPRVTLPLDWAKLDPSDCFVDEPAQTTDGTINAQARRIAELEKALEMTRRELDEATATMTELKSVTTQAGASQDFRDGAATEAAIVEVRMRTLESFGLTLTAEAAQQIAKAIRAEYGGAVNVESLT